MSPFSFTRHPRADLSALVDGQLAPSKAEQVRQHVDSCAQCTEEFAGILATRAVLSALPEVPAPRSFTLTPEQVAGPAPVYEHAPARTRLVNGLRLGSAGLAMALAVVVFIDAGSGGDEDNPTGRIHSNDAAFKMAPSTEEYQSSADASEGQDLFDPAPTEVLTSQPPAADADGEAGGTDQGAGGTTSGGVGGTTTGGGSGVAATDAAAPTAVPATPAPTTRPSEPPTLTPDEAARASDDGSVREEDKAGAEGAEAPDSGDDFEAAESAPEDDGGDGGLLALEVLLALGALGALGASVWVARTSRQTPAGN